MAAMVPPERNSIPTPTPRIAALNNFALAHLGLWVPALALFKCRPARGGYEAVATWRPSSTGRPDKVRKPNLKIVPAGIRDFGAGGVGNGQGYTPLDLVMAAHGCDLDTAFKFLSDHTGWAGERIELLIGPEPKPEVGRPKAEAEVEIPLKPDPETRPQPEAEPSTAAAPAGDELEQYTHDVPGVVGEVHRVDRGHGPPAQPGAGAGGGDLAGRHLDRPPGCRADRLGNPLVCGGDHPHRRRQATSDRLHQRPDDAAGAQGHVGASSFMSGSAICNADPALPAAALLHGRAGPVPSQDQRARCIRA